jgi:hypothetical protein
VPTDVGVLEMRVVPELILQDAPEKRLHYTEGVVN